MLARLEKGRALHGYLDLSSGDDKRWWWRERAEELADAMWYEAFAAVVEEDI